MFRISNTLVGIIHTLPLLLGLAAMCASAYIHVHGDCQKVLQYPLLFGGLFIFIVSALGHVGTLCRVNAALYLYFIVTFFVIVAFSSFTVLALFVTKNNVRDHTVGYGVGDFSPWLRHYVTDDRNWDEARSCLVKERLCHNLVGDALKQFSTTQLGCCRPPVRCGFTMKNATFWEAPKASPKVNNSDCRTWNNRQDKLCYNCDSCKGAVLANIRSQWKHLTIFNVCVLVLVTNIYLLACYAIRNNRLGYSTTY